MKRVFQHPPEPLTGKKYWRSLGELSDTPEFREWLQREFPAGAAQLEGDEWSRRNFLKLMGASMALAGVGLTSCRRPEAHLVPFTKSVEWTIPGKPLFYATAMPRRTGAIPLVVTTHDGRPTWRDRRVRASVHSRSLRSGALKALRSQWEDERSRGL
jgi:molybdopterin-containing oxidoreductase family iron-sulfur binding subunit